MGRIKSDFGLLIVALVWGAAFTSQRMAAQQVSYFTFNGLRYLVASITLLILVRFRLRIPRAKYLMVTITGIVLFAGSVFQQAGLKYTTAANAGFITGMYVVLVPVLLWLIWRKRTKRISWIAAGVAFFGVYLLSSNGQALKLVIGDILEIIGAGFWALHVILIGKLTREMDSIQLSIGQMIVAGVCSLLPAIIFERTTTLALQQTAGAIIFVGLVSNAFGYSLQIWAQKETQPVDAVLILSMEAVFAAVFGYFILRESLMPIQIVGCVLILGSVAVVSMADLGHGRSVNLVNRSKNNG
jgi:drug/metabolite transporter (DMT)-like permease